MSEFTARQKYDFKRDLEQLAGRRGQHTELISLYIPPTRQISDVTAYLRNEYSQASNIKSKQTQKNVLGALESLLSRLKNLRSPPENGLAMFVGAVVTGNNQQRMEAHVLEPPQPVPTFLYRCDSRFFLEPLEGLMAEKEIYGLMLIDRRECTIGFLRGKSIQSVFYDTSQVPGKHGRGGQSQRRFERLTEIAADEWFKRCGERASEIFMAEEKLISILIGGPGPSKRYFMEGGFMHHELEKKILDAFDTGYTDEFGLKELVDNASEALSQLGLMKEKKIFQRFQREIMKLEAAQATYGEDHVRYALEMGAVDTLVLSEGLRKQRVTIGCPNCGDVEGDKSVARDKVEDAPAKGKCPKCQSYLGVLAEKDLIDELSEKAESTGTKVELMSTDSEEGETLLKAFGGIAAMLRYVLPERRN
jgi:peptide chain release factor subunit 1